MQPLVIPESASSSTRVGAIAVTPSQVVTSSGPSSSSSANVGDTVSPSSSMSPHALLTYPFQQWPAATPGQSSSKGSVTPAPPPNASASAHNLAMAGRTPQFKQPSQSVGSTMSGMPGMMLPMPGEPTPIGSTTAPLNEEDIDPQTAELFLQAWIGVNSDKCASCHQCKTTKQMRNLVYCTRVGDAVRKRRWYCDACLIRTHNIRIPLMSSWEIAHWMCPACLGNCTCAACNNDARRKGWFPPSQASQVTPAFNQTNHSQSQSQSQSQPQQSNQAVPTQPPVAAMQQTPQQQMQTQPAVPQIQSQPQQQTPQAQSSPVGLTPSAAAMTMHSGSPPVMAPPMHPSSYMHSMSMPLPVHLQSQMQAMPIYPSMVAPQSISDPAIMQPPPLTVDQQRAHLQQQIQYLTIQRQYLENNLAMIEQQGGTQQTPVTIQNGVQTWIPPASIPQSTAAPLASSVYPQSVPSRTRQTNNNNGSASDPSPTRTLPSTATGGGSSSSSNLPLAMPLYSVSYKGSPITVPNGSQQPGPEMNPAQSQYSYSMSMQPPPPPPPPTAGESSFQANMYAQHLQHRQHQQQQQHQQHQMQQHMNYLYAQHLQQQHQQMAFPQFYSMPQPLYQPFGTMGGGMPMVAPMSVSPFVPGLEVPLIPPYFLQPPVGTDSSSLSMLAAASSNVPVGLMNLKSEPGVQTERLPNPAPPPPPTSSPLMPPQGPVFPTQPSASPPSASSPSESTPSSFVPSQSPLNGDGDSPSGTSSSKLSDVDDDDDDMTDADEVQCRTPKIQVKQEHPPADSDDESQPMEESTEK